MKYKTLMEIFKTSPHQIKKKEKNMKKQKKIFKFKQDLTTVLKNKHTVNQIT